MEKDNLQTDVVFRAWKFEDGKTEIFALFPSVPWDRAGQFCTSYAHFGQHSPAHYQHCIRKSRPAKSSEYFSLMAELISIGYRLKVRKKA